MATANVMSNDSAFVACELGATALKNANLASDAHTTQNVAPMEDLKAPAMESQANTSQDTTDKEVLKHLYEKNFKQVLEDSKLHCKSVLPFRLAPRSPLCMPAVNVLNSFVRPHGSYGSRSNSIRLRSRSRGREARLPDDNKPDVGCLWSFRRIVAVVAQAARSANEEVPSPEELVKVYEDHLADVRRHCLDQIFETRKVDQSFRDKYLYAQCKGEEEEADQASFEVELERAIQSSFKDMGGSRFRCELCPKMFRGGDFVKKHILKSHPEIQEHVRTVIENEQLRKKFFADHCSWEPLVVLPVAVGLGQAA